MSQSQREKREPLLVRLSHGQTCYALGIRNARTPDIVRMAATLGYDAIWVDLEHSTMSLEAASGMCLTAADLGLAAWVRPPDGDLGSVGRLLDGGASGLIIPAIATAADARRAADACRYPPRGGRSQNALLPSLGFARVPHAERVAASNGHVVLQVLLETAEGVGNADAIAATDGVDVIGLGLNDLSANFGILGQGRHPRILEACRSVIAAAQKHGKLAIIGGLADADHYRDVVALGASRYVFAAIDTDILSEALGQRLSRWQSLEPAHDTLQHKAV
jgi:2-keto-3-deoxy-L-rhamnonate aldolase RhmA